MMFLNTICGHDLDLTRVLSSRKSLINVEAIPADETTIKELPPFMKFVSRLNESKEMLQLLKDQLDTDFSDFHEPIKRVVIPTVAGTAGKGKTTFCRRFLEGEALTGFPIDFQNVVSDCILNGRRYRIAYTTIEHTEFQNV